MSLLTSLISYWKMDEASGNATDSHGSNTLTDNNTVTSGTGKINNARSFAAASSEFLSSADNASLSTGDIDFTISLWVNLASKVTGDAIAKLASSADANTSEYTLRYDSSLDRFSWYVSQSIGTGDWNNVVANNFGAPSTGTWYHIVVWHDSAANQVGISVNNGTANTLSTTGAPSDQTCGFAIGRPGDFAGVYWNGLIDEVAFWKRTLTTQERTNLYNGGTGLPYPLNEFDPSASRPWPPPLDAYRPRLEVIAY